MHTSAELHDEHAHLLEHVADIRTLAREAPNIGPEGREERLDRVLGFLDGTLLPHAREEERGLYADVAEILGDARSIAPMLHEHRVIGEYVEQLGAVDVTDVARLQELLYGSYALIIAHFRREEELYLPLLGAH